MRLSAYGRGGGKLLESHVLMHDPKRAQSIIFRSGRIDNVTVIFVLHLFAW